MYYQKSDKTCLNNNIEPSKYRNGPTGGNIAAIKILRLELSLSVEWLRPSVTRHSDRDRGRVTLTATVSFTSEPTHSGTDTQSRVVGSWDVSTCRVTLKHVLNYLAVLKNRWKTLIKVKLQKECQGTSAGLMVLADRIKSSLRKLQIYYSYIIYSSCYVTHSGFVVLCPHILWI